MFPSVSLNCLDNIFFAPVQGKNHGKTQFSSETKQYLHELQWFKPTQREHRVQNIASLHRTAVQRRCHLKYERIQCNSGIAFAHSFAHIGGNGDCVCANKSFVGVQAIVSWVECADVCVCAVYVSPSLRCYCCTVLWWAVLFCCCRLSRHPSNSFIKMENVQIHSLIFHGDYGLWVCVCVCFIVFMLLWCYTACNYIAFGWHVSVSVWHQLKLFTIIWASTQMSWTRERNKERRIWTWSHSVGSRRRASGWHCQSITFSEASGWA